MPHLQWLPWMGAKTLLRLLYPLATLSPILEQRGYQNQPIAYLVMLRYQQRLERQFELIDRQHCEPQQATQKLMLLDQWYMG